MEVFDVSRRQRVERMHARRDKLLGPRVQDLILVTRLATESAACPGSLRCTTGKFTALCELLQDHTRIPAGDKVVVFAACKEALPVLHEALKAVNVKSLLPTLHNKHMIATFRTSADRVLLLQAGDSTSGTSSAGIDLPFAKHVVLLDVVAADVEQQCIKRVRRIGQVYITTVWKIRTDASIDAPLSVAANGRRISAGIIHVSLFDEVAKHAATHLERLIAARAAAVSFDASSGTAEGVGVLQGSAPLSRLGKRKPQSSPTEPVEWWKFRKYQKLRTDAYTTVQQIRADFHAAIKAELVDTTEIARLARDLSVAQEELEHYQSQEEEVYEKISRTVVAPGAPA